MAIKLRDKPPFQVESLHIDMGKGLSFQESTVGRDNWKKVSAGMQSETANILAYKRSWTWKTPGGDDGGESLIEAVPANIQRFVQGIPNATYAKEGNKFIEMDIGAVNSPIVEISYSRIVRACMEMLLSYSYIGTDGKRIKKYYRDGEELEVLWNGAYYKPGVITHVLP